MIAMGNTSRNPHRAVGRDDPPSPRRSTHDRSPQGNHQLSLAVNVHWQLVVFSVCLQEDGRHRRVQEIRIEWLVVNLRRWYGSWHAWTIGVRHLWVHGSFSSPNLFRLLNKLL